MKALLCTDSGVVLKTGIPKPETNNDEVLVKIRMAGICRTDLELSKGYMGYSGILGHEFVGEVESGSEKFPAGTRVVGEINAGCGECAECRRAMQRHCPNRSVLGILKRSGCMAEWTTLPEENLLAAPDTVSDEEAVFTEPLAAALEIFEQVFVEPTHRVAVIGDGKLGMLIAMVFAHKHEGETTLIGHHAEKLEIIKDSCRVTLENALQSSEYKQWDVVVDATGSSGGLRLAMQLVKPRGTIVLKSTMAQPEKLDLTPIVIDEVTIVGSRCGRFEPALRLLEKKAVPVQRLVDAVYPLDDALTAWQKAVSKGTKKVLLKMM